MEAVSRLIEQGKVRYAVVCNYDAAQLTEAERYFTLASDQVPYSMVKRNIEAGLTPYCQENNRSILAYSPLERGLLAGKIWPGHAFAPGDHRKEVSFFKEENLRRPDALFELLKPLAAEKHLTLGQLVILWTLQQPGIIIALVGARNCEQAIENVKAIDSQLSNEEVATVLGYLEHLELIA